MVFDTRLRRFISGKKLSLFFDSAVYAVRPDTTLCYRTFQSPTNRDVPRTEKCVTRNQIGTVPARDWLITIQLQDCNGSGENKTGVHIVLQPFSPSLSKSFPSLPIPSIQMSSINSYSNGIPVYNRRQALEMWGQLIIDT